jgi:hypothetical protein
MDLDPNAERIKLVCWTLEDGINCHRKVYEQNNETTSVQTTPDKYFPSKQHINFPLDF